MLERGVSLQLYEVSPRLAYSLTLPLAGSRLRLDFKRGVGRHLSFLFVDAVDLGPTRAVVQPPGKFGQLFFRPHGVHLHPPVIEVSHISAEAEFGRDTLRKIPEPYALHAPAHSPAAGG